jgi:hypothetical protein
MQSRRKYQSGLAIVQAMLAVCVALAIHAAFPRALGGRLPFAPFAVAILAACRWGGRSAGWSATVLGAMALHAWCLSPASTFWDEGRMGLALFVAAGFFVSAQAPILKPQTVAPAASPAPAKPGEPLPMFEYNGPAGSPAGPKRMAA